MHAPVHGRDPISGWSGRPRPYTATAMTSHASPTVADYMTKLPATVAPDLSLADAQERMYVNNIRHLVVEREGLVVGVISTRDVVVAAALEGIDPAKTSVAAAMVKSPYTCSPETSLVDVALEMEANKYGCAIVVEAGEAVGLFTTTDALRALRSVVTGVNVEPATKSTVHPDKPSERPRVPHATISARQPHTKTGGLVGHD